MGRMFHYYNLNLKSGANILDEHSAGRSAGRSITKPVLVAVLAGISIFFSVFFLLSPNASSQKYSGPVPVIKAPGIGTIAKESGAVKEVLVKNQQDTHALKRYDFRLSGNDTFYKVMSVFNVSGTQITEIIRKSAPVYDLRRLKKDAVLRVYAADDRIETVEYRYSDYQTLLVKNDPKDGFRVEKAELPHETRSVRVTGAIMNSFYEDGIKAGADPQGIMAFSDIFAWDVDFASDIRRGDTFAIIYETLFVEGKMVRTGRILGAEMTNGGRKYTAVYFAGSDGKGGFYDASGKSLKRMFLKSPLRYSRITSYFTNKRFHPILRQYRPHHGIDYAAPMGTPAEAAAGGHVVFAGWKGGYGNFVEVKHPNGYITGYGHLSRIAKGIRPGASVEQGTVIGFVGSTGLSTGPHLHYEVRHDNALINPLGIKAEAGKTIEKRDLARFSSVKDDMLRRLAGEPAVSVAAKAPDAPAKKGVN